jgi:hypothetical protein
MPGLEKQAVAAMEGARETYMTLGHDNFDPMLHVIQKNDDRDVIILMKGVPTGYLYEAVQRVLSEMGLDPEAIFVINDAYGVYYGEESTQEQREYEEAQLALGGMRTPLGERFAKGDPWVREMLTVTGLSSTETVLVNQIYRWTPVDGWEWNEPKITSESTTDWVWDRLVNGQPKPEMTEMINRAKEIGEQE